MNRNEMIKSLKAGVCNVQFNKVSGEFRDMKCTLSTAFIPADKMPKNNEAIEQETNVNESVIRVFDVTANGWRSFKVDSVIKFITA